MMVRGALWTTIAAACMLFFASISMAFAAAWIQWDGGPVVNLQLINNPDYGSGIQEYPYLWYGEFNALTLDYPQVLHAVGGGGPYVDSNGKPIYVRIKQVIQNTGTESWIDFHIRIDGGAFPYKKWDSWPDGWNVSQTLEGYDYWTTNPAYSIDPGESFFDGIEFFVIDVNGEGSYELRKWATVPEPGALAAMAAGLVSLGAGLRYRKLRRKA